MRKKTVINAQSNVISQKVFRNMSCNTNIFAMRVQYFPNQWYGRMSEWGQGPSLACSWDNLAQLVKNAIQREVIKSAQRHNRV